MLSTPFPSRYFCLIIIIWPKTWINNMNHFLRDPAFEIFRLLGFFSLFWSLFVFSLWLFVFLSLGLVFFLFLSFTFFLFLSFSVFLSCLFFLVFIFVVFVFSLGIKVYIPRCLSFFNFSFGDRLIRYGEDQSKFRPF